MSFMYIGHRWELEIWNRNIKPFHVGSGTAGIIFVGCGSVMKIFASDKT